MSLLAPLGWWVPSGMASGEVGGSLSPSAQAICSLKEESVFLAKLGVNRVPSVPFVMPV